MSKQEQEESIAYDRAAEEGMKMYSQAIDRHREIKGEALHLLRTTLIIIGILVSGTAAFSDTITSLPFLPQVFFFLSFVPLFYVPLFVLMSITSTPVSFTPEKTILGEFLDEEYGNDEFDKRMVEEINQALVLLRDATNTRNKYLFYGYTSFVTSLLFVSIATGTILLSYSPEMIVAGVAVLVGIVITFWRGEDSHSYNF